MAIGSNCATWVYATDTTARAAAAASNFTGVTVDIPEATTRNFLSAIVFAGWRDNGAAAASATAVTIGIGFDGGAVNDAAVTETITETGEHMSPRASRDVTSLFTSNFTGASHTVELRVTVSTQSRNNTWAILAVSYTFDDSAQDTRVKTVFIPIGSPLSRLTNTLTEVGNSMTNQIPLLDTWCPEASKSFKNIAIVARGEEGTDGAATDYSYGFRIDAGGTEHTTATIEQALISNTLFQYSYVANSMATNAAHALYMRVASGISNGWLHPAIFMVVTYTYSHTNSTTIMNSLRIPLGTPLLMSFDTGDKARFEVDVWVEEPTTITIRQSGVELHWQSFNAGTFYTGPAVGVGTQTVSTYTHTAPNAASCSPICVMHRFGEGAQGGSGVTLARGKNTIYVDVYRTNSSSNRTIGLTGVMYLNYTSGKATGGANTHNHTLQLMHTPYTADAQQLEVTPTAIAIPETNYWINGFGLECALMGAFTGDTGYSLHAERAAGEGQGAGWLPVGFYHGDNSGEHISFYVWHNLAPYFDRWNADTDANRLGIETSRKYAWYQVSTIWFQATYLLTYHAITFAKTGTITGNTTAAGSLTVRWFNVSEGLYLGTCTPAGDGTFTFTWFDDTSTYIATCDDPAGGSGASNEASS